MESKPFESKIWLSSPTMHGDEIKYVTEAYETNWISTVGKNINEVERLASEHISCQVKSCTVRQSLIRARFRDTNVSCS